MLFRVFGGTLGCSTTKRWQRWSLELNYAKNRWQRQKNGCWLMPRGSLKLQSLNLFLFWLVRRSGLGLCYFLLLNGKSFTPFQKNKITSALRGLPSVSSIQVSQKIYRVLYFESDSKRKWRPNPCGRRCVRRVFLHRVVSPQQVHALPIYTQPA